MYFRQNFNLKGGGGGVDTYSDTLARVGANVAKFGEKVCDKHRWQEGITFLELERKIAHLLKNIKDVE